MDQAPPPSMADKSHYQVIKAKDLEDKEIYIFKEYTFIIGLLGENLNFICSRNKRTFQVSKSFDTIIKEIPNFKLSKDIKSIYNILLTLFNSNKYSIEDDGISKVKVVIKLKDILGNDELHDIILYQIELDQNTKIELMEERINKLEKKTEQLTKENLELKEKINVLYNLLNGNNLIKKIKDELSINKNDINNINLPELKEIEKPVRNFIQINSIKFESSIIQTKKEIMFILDEIQRKIGSINNIKLIYNATSHGDSIDEFHKKCDYKPNTLMIVQTSKGFKFGGFTSTGWNDNRGKEIYDKKAFCFSINLNKIYNIIKPENALHIQSDDGRPSFGTVSYVFILQNNFLSNNGNYVNKMKEYKGESISYEINGYEKDFKAKEVEVFQINYET